MKRAKSKIQSNLNTKRNNDLPLRDKNGRFISNKKYKLISASTKGLKSPKKAFGIATRLRKRNHEYSTKGTPSRKEMRTTRSMAKLENSEEKKSTKKRHAKSIEKDLGSSEVTSVEELKLNTGNDSNKRALFLMSKRFPIYQEYDDFLKRRRKDKRAEFISYAREPGEEVLSKKNNADLLKYYGGYTEDTF